MSSNLLINSNLSDVQIFPGFVTKKEHRHRFRMGLEKLADKASEADLPELSEGIQTCIKALSGDEMTAADTLHVSSTLFSSLWLFDTAVQDWSEGEYDPVDIRNAVQFRQALTFWLFEICDYQTKLVYQSLAK